MVGGDADSGYVPLESRKSAGPEFDVSWIVVGPGSVAGLLELSWSSAVIVPLADLAVSVCEAVVNTRVVATGLTVSLCWASLMLSPAFASEAVICGEPAVVS